MDDMLFWKVREGHLSEQQMTCLCFLLDGNWHDRRELRRVEGMKNVAPSTISERIIRPLESIDLVEQEARSVKEGSKQKKNFVRIRKDIDVHRLHLLIEYSANRLVTKYRKKKCRKSQFLPGDAK
ncbi:MAG: hypothetical protein A4E48_00115 [Methanosaeta sp. PtaU1.Bin060]|nr:MAG: hypothetical protein A4E48_00115 [Methanosaeta sp. PtaU1.Bin060]